MELYNELSRTVETFHPLTGTVTIYVCGITPYDTTHLGHAFTYLSFDVLIRYLEYQGYSVRYVQNVTDIDDDIIRKGKELGEDWLALGNRWTRHFIEDLKRLNVRPPDVYPRATDVIPQMFEAIQTLIVNGHAYESNGNVYFDVSSDPDFGKVSGLAPEEWLPIANERGNVADDPNKRAPLDFVLWQAAKPGEPTWESPWGKGRPGWHIECSTMSRTYLGDVIDVHGGGSDLQFPHHECETAQSCGVTGKGVFARFWMHTAMVRYQGEKMSKSLGNLIWARDLMERYNEDTVRVLLSRHPYHQVWEYDAAELAPAQAMAQRLLEAIAVQGGDGVPVPIVRSVSEFEAAMDDNLATDRALDVLDGLARDILRAAAAQRNVTTAQRTLRRLCAVFGLRLDGETEQRVQQGWDTHYRRFI